MPGRVGDADRALDWKALRVRHAGLGALLVAEYLALSWRFDAADLGARGGLATLRHAGELSLVAALAAVATVALQGRRLGERLRGLRLDLRPPRGAWLLLVAHALAFAALWLLTARLFETSTTAWRSWIAPWALAALATPLSLAPLVLPWKAFRALGRTLASALAIGLLVAALAFGLGKLTTLFWLATGRLTLTLVVALLRPVVQPVGDPERFFVVGTPEFVVELGPKCSGFEGMGLMTVFLGAYIWLRRDRLRLGRALALLPVALVTSWAANAVRIAALILLGHGYSPAVALGGFHSKAGWIFFCALALGFVVLLGRVSFWQREPATDGELRSVGGGAAAPYLLPALALIATGMLTGLLSTGLDPLWALRAAAAGAFLWAYRDHYRRLRWRPTLWAPATGTAVFLVWIALIPADAQRHASVADGLAGLGAAPAVGWLALRALGSTAIVPLAEELAFRGYLMRRLIDADFEAVAHHRFSWLAFLASSLAFGVVHEHWVAGTLAGMGFGLAYVRGAGLADAVAAHAVTNVLIAGHVLLFDALHLW